jgi:hypothetical protein
VPRLVCRSDDGRARGGVLKRDARIRIPPRPDIIRGPEILTVGAFGVALIASAMTFPIFVQSFTWSGTPEGPGPSGWPTVLWIVAFFIGVPSMLLALVARHRERRRGSEAGQRLAKRAITAAIVGSCLSGWSFMVAASAGL